MQKTCIKSHWNNSGLDKITVGRLQRTSSEYINKNIFINTSGKYKPEALESAIAVLGANYVLFAAVYPYLLEQAALNRSRKVLLAIRKKRQFIIRTQNA